MLTWFLLASAWWVSFSLLRSVPHCSVVVFYYLHLASYLPGSHQILSQVKVVHRKNSHKIWKVEVRQLLLWAGSGWPQIHDGHSALAFQLLGLQAWVTMPGPSSQFYAPKIGTGVSPHAVAVQTCRLMCFPSQHRSLLWQRMSALPRHPCALMIRDNRRDQAVFGGRSLSL